MENIFKELKGKIGDYEKILSINTIEVDTSEDSKIENEIKTMKSKIEELTNSMEGKSKIEKMKITLNISSLESEITLKEMDLDEKKEKSKNEYENKVKSHNNELENSKKDIERFINNSEAKIENAVKIGNDSILLGSDLEEVKGYCKNILETELKNLKDVMSEESRIEQRIENLENEIKTLCEERMDWLNKADYWYSKYPTNFWGDYDEDKADECTENGDDCKDEMNACSRKITSKSNEKEPLQKEVEKLKIKRETIQNKINTINEMVDEMIKEVIKEELKKREIVIPAFVPVTKYFNAPSEEE